MNHNNKHQEQRPTIDGNDKIYQHTYGSFDLSSTDILNDLVSDDDDDTVKQDYDLDNLYTRERDETEDQTDTMSEDDEMESMDIHIETSVETVQQSRTSNRSQSIEEEHALSQKLSQLLSSPKSQTKRLSNKKISETVKMGYSKKAPDYLAKTDKSFENMINSVLIKETTTATSSKRDDFRQMAIFIHQIRYNEILSSLWTIYLKSGLGELKAQHPRNTLGPQVWPIPVKSMVKINIRSGIKEHDACLNYVNDRLVELRKGIKESQSNLHDQISRLPDYSSSIIRQAIETFLEEKLTNLHKKIEHKILLVHYDYDERILELQYLQHHPTEAQIQLANQRCIAQQQHEMTKYELQLLEKRITHYNSSPSSAFDSLPISRAPIFDSINNAEVKQQLYNQYREVVEQLKADMFNLYISSATTQMQRYQRQNNNGIKKMWQDQRSLPDDQKLAPVMIDLIEQRVKIITERIKCIYNFKAQTLSVQS